MSLGTETDQFAYYGISPSVLRDAFRRWIETLASPSEVDRYSFIDLGSGLGRALLLATELPFREVIGVESIGELVTGAKKNIEIWVSNTRGLPPIDVYQQDVRDFQFPTAPVVIFLYNPFGEQTLVQVLKHLLTTYQKQSNAVDVLYCHPKYGFVFTEENKFKEVWIASIPLDTEDRSADAFHSSLEVCAMYRLVH